MRGRQAGFTPAVAECPLLSPSVARSNYFVNRNSRKVSSWLGGAETAIAPSVASAMERIRAIEGCDAARFSAFRRAIRAILTRRARRLQSIEPLLEAAGLEGRAFGGMHEIPLDHVVGFAAPPSKASDFDPGFLPVNRRMRDRWTRIYQAMVEGDGLPPIDVYKGG